MVEWQEGGLRVTGVGAPLGEEAGERFNFILPSQEDQHIPGSLLLVDLDDGAQRGIQVRVLLFRSVHHLYRILPTLYRPQALPVMDA